MSHVTGVFSDDGASTFIENMLKDEPSSPTRGIQRSQSASSIPQELLLTTTAHNIPADRDGDWGWASLNDVASSEEKPMKRRSRRGSKGEHTKRRKKRSSNISNVRDVSMDAPSTPTSGPNTAPLRGKQSPSDRIPIPELKSSLSSPHTPPRRMLNARSPRKVGRRMASPSSGDHERRQMSPSPGRSPSGRRRSSTTRRKMSRSRSPAGSRSVSPSSAAGAASDNHSTSSSRGSHRSSSTRRRRSRTSSAVMSISPAGSWDKGSASGNSSFGSIQSAARTRRRSRTSYNNAPLPVRERSLSPGGLQKSRKVGNLSRYLNDGPEEKEKIPFRRLSPRSSQSIRRRSNTQEDWAEKMKRRGSDPIAARTERLRSSSPSFRWHTTACSKSPPSVTRRRSKSPSSRQLLSKLISANQKILLDLANEDWDVDDSVVWKQPSKAKIMMEDESSWTHIQ